MNNATTISHPYLNRIHIHKHKYNKSLQINIKDQPLFTKNSKRFNCPSCSNQSNASKKSLTETMKKHPLTPSSGSIALGSHIRYDLPLNSPSFNNSLSSQKRFFPSTSSNRLVLMKSSQTLNFNRRLSIKDAIPRLYEEKLRKRQSLQAFKSIQSHSNGQIALISKRYKKKLLLFSNEKSESISHLNTNANNRTNEIKDFASPLITCMALTPTNKLKEFQRKISAKMHIRNMSHYVPEKARDIDEDSKSYNFPENPEDEKSQSRTRVKRKRTIEDELKRRITALLIQMKIERRGNIREIDKKLREDIKGKEYHVKETMDDLRRLQSTNDENLKKIVFITKNIV